MNLGEDAIALQKRLAKHTAIPVMQQFKLGSSKVTYKSNG